MLGHSNPRSHMTTHFTPATLAELPTLTDAELSTMRLYRLKRIRAELKQRDYAGILHSRAA